MSWAKISQLSTNISEWKKKTTICQKPLPCREIYEGWVGGAGQDNWNFATRKLDHMTWIPPGCVHLTLVSLLCVRRTFSASIVP